MNDKVLKFSEFLVKESLPQQSTVNQLKKIKSVMNREIGGDIGDKISDMNKHRNVYCRHRSLLFLEPR
jgi:hypothetical protein